MKLISWRDIKNFCNSLDEKWLEMPATVFIDNENIEDETRCPVESIVEAEDIGVNIDNSPFFVI